MRAMTAVLAMAISAGFAGGQGAPQPDPVPIASRPVSPAVIATWGSDTADDGSPRLTFLVLWRGTPGWVWPGPFGTTTTGDPQQVGVDDRRQTGRLRQQISVGRTTFDVTVNASSGVATIHDQRIDLRKTNVVLVDDVNTGAGMRIARTLWIDPQLPAPDRVQAVIRRSPELRDFLRCDAHFDDPAKEQVARALCAMTIGESR